MRRALLFMGAVALSACVELETKPTPPRLLDQVCRGDTCGVSGAVSRTTGPTADTIAYHFGPGAGSLSIPLSALLEGGQGASDLPSVRALVSGHGKLEAEVVGGECGSGCESATQTVPSAYDWIDFELATPSNTGSDAAGGGPGALVFSVADDGSELDLADLRYSPAINCSVVAPGAAD